MNGTPILDIKPYLPYCDAHPEALGGFGEAHKEERIPVEFPEDLLAQIPTEKREGLLGVLEQDPRAAYQKKNDSVYGLSFAGFDIRFTVKEGVLVVNGVEEVRQKDYKKVK